MQVAVAPANLRLNQRRAEKSMRESTIIQRIKTYAGVVVESLVRNVHNSERRTGRISAQPSEYGRSSLEIYLDLVDKFEGRSHFFRNKSKRGFEC